MSSSRTAPIIPLKPCSSSNCLNESLALRLLSDCLIVDEEDDAKRDGLSLLAAIMAMKVGANGLLGPKDGSSEETSRASSSCSCSSENKVDDV